MPFVLGNAALTAAEAKKKRARINVENVLIADAAQVPMPDAVRKQLSSSSGILIGIDVETHAFIEGNLDFHNGDFGFQREVDPVNFCNLKIVQVAWAIAEMSAAEPNIKCRFVKPEEFVITPEATSKHKITQKHAMIYGLPLGEVLREMFSDIKGAHAEGGRLCAHHLEFDAGMLAAAMSSIGFTDMLAQWEAIVRDGICTMDPNIASWVRSTMGGGYIPKYVPIKLVDAIKAMAPEHADLIQDHHNAATDCHMHWVLARALSRRALA